MRKFTVWLLLVLFGAIGGALMVAQERSADQQLMVVSGIASPLVEAAPQPPYPLATEVAQILLHAEVFRLDTQKLEKAGVVLDDLLRARRGMIFASPAAAKRAESVVNPREAELIRTLLLASGGGQVVSRPSLTTTDGTQAMCKFGGEFPNPPHTLGTAAAAEFHEFGTTIEITPKLMADDSTLRLEVSCEQSTLDPAFSVKGNGTDVPRLSSKKLETVFELKQGQTAILRGPDAGNLLLMVTTEIIPPQPQPRAPTRLPPPSTVKRAVSRVPAGADLDVKILEGRSRVLVFAQKTHRVTVRDPNVIEVHPVGPQRLQVTAKQTGTTRLAVHTEGDGRQDIKVTVAADPNDSVSDATDHALEIPRGMRVISLNRVGGVSETLHPGDFVDVLSLVNAAKETHVNTLTQGTRVFAIDHPTHTISLLVTPQQAEQLLLASESGRLYVIAGSEPEPARAEPESTQAVGGEEAHKLGAYPPPLEVVIKKLFPKSQISVMPLANSVLLRGKLDSRHHDTVIQIAMDYFPRVINDLQVAAAAPPTAPRPAETRGPAPDLNGSVHLDREMRELREEVRALSRDVSRLIELMEVPSTGAEPAPAPESGSSDYGPKPEDDLSQLLQPVSDERVWERLGIRVKPSEVETDRFRGGLEILAVRSGSAAAQNEIRPGDILVGLDKWETIERKHLDYVLQRVSLEGKTTLKFYVVRGEETLWGRTTLPGVPITGDAWQPRRE